MTLCREMEIPARLWNKSDEILWTFWSCYTFFVEPRKAILHPFIQDVRFGTVWKGVFLRTLLIPFFSLTFFPVHENDQPIFHHEEARYGMNEKPNLIWVTQFPATQTTFDGLVMPDDILGKLCQGGDVNFLAKHVATRYWSAALPRRVTRKTDMSLLFCREH